MEDRLILRTGIVQRTQNSPKSEISIRVVLSFEMFSAFRPLVIVMETDMS